MKRLNLKPGFSLVELMVVVAIIAILTAIALPIYSNMIAKAKTQRAIGAAQKFRGTLSAWFDINEGFRNMTFDANTGKIRLTNVDGITVVMDSDLPAATGLSWRPEALNGATSSTFILNFDFDNGHCMPCSGRWCLTCTPSTGDCRSQIEMTDPDSPALASLSRGEDACPAG